MMNDWRKHLTSRRHDNVMMDKARKRELEVRSLAAVNSSRFRRRVFPYEAP